MRAIRRTFARIVGLLRDPRHREDDLRAEMDAHLEMATAENIRRGLSADDARRHAMVASGGLTQAAELTREQRSLPWVEGVLTDARYASRHFRRTPLATIIMIVVLSLGVGTNVVLFTVLNSLVTMAAPGVRRDASLVRIRGIDRVQGRGNQRSRLMSWPEVQEYAGRTDLFASVAALTEESALIKVGDAASAPLSVKVVYAMPNYYSILNIRPAAGSLPAAEPDVTQMRSSPTAMISHSLWQQSFGGDPDVVGRTLRVNDFPVTIVGVAPPRFVGTDASSGPTIWMPLAANPLIQKRSSVAFLSSDSTFLNAIARLDEGVTTRAASSVVAGIAQRATRPSSNTALPPGRTRIGTADVVSMRVTNARADDGSKFVLTTVAAFGFALLVLLITCTNVSAIMVGLAVARRREIAVRLSLGAPRRRLIRQLLTETVLLALIAAAIGLAVTAAGVRIASTSLDDVQLVVDWRVTIATCAIAIATGILLGVSPALHATRLSVSEVLKSASSSVAATRSRLQPALVVLQITLTQPLLVGLGVVMVTMLSDMGTGTRASAPSQIAEIEVDTWTNHASNAERAARIAAIVDRIGAMPGVAAALPMQMGTITASVMVHPADRIAGIAYETEVDARMISAPKGYFGAFNVPIVRGRDFDPRELIQRSDDASHPVSFESVIIGDGLARRYWGDANPIGRRLQMAGARHVNDPPMVIVGVIDDAAAGPSEANGQIRVYVPYAPMNTGVIARTVGPAKAFLEPMRKVVMDAAPQMPIYRVETMEQREAEFRRDVIRGGAVAAGGGLLALLLSAIGLYAVVSFSVGQRTREIGIRTALGAQRSTVVRMFFTKGLALSALGLLLGLPLSMVATRIIAQTLNWPMSSSPLIGVVIGGVVVGVASLAAWIPARRASTIDPIVALRID